MGELPRIAATHAESRHTCMLLDAFAQDPTPQGDAVAGRILDELWTSSYDPASDKFLTTYFPQTTTTLELAPGCSITLPLGRDAIGLSLGEICQRAGNLTGAVAVVESLDPSEPAAVSLAELYCQQGHWQEVMDMTNGLVPDSPFTAFLITQRGSALRESGHLEASREALKTVIARRSLSPEIRHRALIERSSTNLADGKVAAARKDLEKILADNANYPGLREALHEIQPGRPSATVNSYEPPPTSPVTTEQPSPPPDAVRTHQRALHSTDRASGSARTVDGYMIRARWDGTILELQATNKFARVALLGPDAGEADTVKLPVANIHAVTLKEAGALTNGSLTVVSGDRKYQAHFLRKDQASWLQLAEELRDSGKR